MQILLSLAHAFESARDLSSAAEYMQQAVDLCAQLHGRASQQFLDDKGQLAVYYWKSDQPNLAQPVLEDLLRETREVHGELHAVCQYWCFLIVRQPS